MIYKLSEQIKREQNQKFQKLAEERGHIIISGQYEGKNSKLILYCPKSQHGQWETTFDNYRRSKTGCQKCGYELVSEKLTGRIFSEETIEKMRIANNRRPNRGGKPRRWRENADYRNFKRSVFELYNNECAITGIKRLQAVACLPLIVHHLISAHISEDLTYEPRNGIILAAPLHVLFHKKFGYKNNSFQQMRHFLLFLLDQKNQNEILKFLKTFDSQFKTNYSMLISNQAYTEGSETRVFDSERIIRLHEHLGQIEKTILQLYFEVNAS